MAQTYGKPKVAYYTPIQEEENKAQKRSKTKIIGLTVASVLVAAGVVISLLNNKKMDFSSLEKAGKKIQDLDLKDKIPNVMSNFVTIKDDLWDRLTKNVFDKFKIGKLRPLGFVSKIGKLATNFYHSLAPKAYIPEWNDKKMKVIELANKEGINVDIPDFKKLYNSIAKEMEKAIHGSNERLTKNLFDGNFIKKITSDNIANERIYDVALNAKKEIKINGKISEELQNALDDLNNYKIKSFEKLIPKIRDITVGSAPTDLLTIILSMISLGSVVATSDTKEEKQAVVINLGIPLITTLITAMIAQVKSISGAAGLAFGLIFGQIASFAAKGISKLCEIHNKKTYERIKRQVLEEQKNAL